MEIRKLIELLRATIEPSQRAQAEQELDMIHKIIGFAPTLLQIVMLGECEMPVRQAGVIYLKNLISQNWADKDPSSGTDEAPSVPPFALHEQDRAVIRDQIVDAVVHAPDLIRTQLTTCVNIMVKHDFPQRWTQIVDKISIYLSNPEPTGWHGALLCLYQLVKNFEYKKAEERAPLHEAMQLLLPQLYQLEVRLLAEADDGGSEQSVLLQKEGLKVFFALTQYILPLQLITRDVFAQWMEICRRVVERGVPPAALAADEDDRPALPWWKCKKWAMHILCRMFERYGSPGHVSKEYATFATWFMPTFSAGLLGVMLRNLETKRSGQWVSPRVLQQTLNYMNQAVSHSLTWKILKPHMDAVVRDVLYPLLCYTAEDHELWVSDPHEYIRIKFDVFEDFVSPVSAAQSLLHSACRKRKAMLQQAMILATTVLTDPSAEPSRRDGALHLVGSLADILLKKRVYADQLDAMFAKFVLPEFGSPHGHMRARACWVLHYFAEFSFKQEPILAEAVRLTLHALRHDADLPVRVEAAVALQSLLAYQERTHKYVEPQAKEVALELLGLIRETENEDVTTVMQKMVCIFTEQLAPSAVDICTHLAGTFVQVLDSAEGSDEKAITAMGLLNTIETVLNVMEERPQIVSLLEPIVVQVVAHVLQHEIQEFYEEVLELVFDLTNKHVSEDMWKVFELIYRVFMKNGADYFTDMMPSLHNYITVDAAGFLAAEERPLAIYNMCKAVLGNRESGEDPESHAAKLLEVVLLQYRRKIDGAAPQFAQLAAERLQRNVQTSELRTMCLQVLIAALYYDPQLLLQVAEKQPPRPDGQPFMDFFVSQWMHDVDCFLGVHDRKLCVLGMCALISMPLTGRPQMLASLAGKIVPSFIVLFDGLKRAYAAKAAEAAEEEESDDEDEDAEGDEEIDAGADMLSSDEDEVDDEGQDYLAALSRKTAGAHLQLGAITAAVESQVIDGSDDDDSNDSDYDPSEETLLETYTTPLEAENCDIDEYVAFKQTMQHLQTAEPEWYAILTAELTPAQLTSLTEIAQLADQRTAARESKLIQQQGGYMFTQQAVPTTFNFGGAPPQS